MDHCSRRSRSRRLTLEALKAALAAVLACLPSIAAAQTFDAVGVRAQGMGGAFVAVADDASAGWWNPAGLATGAFADVTIEYNQIDDASTNPISRGTAFGYPALGLSYYRFPVNQFRLIAPTGDAITSREDEGVLSQYAISVAQSITRHFVIASTVKVMRAADSHVEIDAGAMISYGVMRIGATVRNLRQVTIATDTGNTLQLERQTRAGIALIGHTPGQIETAMVSFDVDLRRTHTVFGEERRVAGGAEIWTKGRTFGLRGGIGTNTIGDSGAALSGGASLALHHGAYIEGQLTGGSDVSRRGWSSGVRLTF